MLNFFTKNRFFFLLFAFTLPHASAETAQVTDDINVFMFEYNEDKRKSSLEDERRFLASHSDYKDALKAENSELAVKILKNILKLEPGNYVAKAELLAVYCNFYPMTKSLAGDRTQLYVSKMLAAIIAENSNYYKAWSILSSCGSVDYDNLKIAAEIGLRLNEKDLISRYALAIGLFASGDHEAGRRNVEMVRKNADAFEMIMVGIVFLEAWELETSDLKRKKSYLEETLAVFNALKSSPSVPVRRSALFNLSDLAVLLEQWNLLEESIKSLDAMHALSAIDNAYYRGVLAISKRRFDECAKLIDAVPNFEGPRGWYLASKGIKCYAPLGRHEKVLQLYTKNYRHDALFSYSDLSAAIDAATFLEKKPYLLQYLKQAFVFPRRMRGLCLAALSLDTADEALKVCEKAYAVSGVSACDKADMAVEMADTYAKAMGMWSKKEEFYYQEAFDNSCAPNQADILDAMFERLGIQKKSELKERLQAMMKSFPNNVLPRTYFAKFLIQFEHDPKEALKVMRTLGSPTGNGDEVFAFYGQMIDTHIALDDQRSALKAADEYLTRDPSPGALYLKVHVYSFHDGYDKSAKKIVEEIEKNKGIIDSQGYGQNLAIIHANALKALKKPDEAIAVLKKALPGSGYQESAHNYWIARIYAEDKKDCASAKPYADKAWKGSHQKVGTWGWNAGSASTDISLNCGFD